MSLVRIADESLEFIRVAVSAKEEGNVVDPTSFPVEMAFPTPQVDPVTWYVAEWEAADGVYYARCLVGPGGAAELLEGPYDVYVKISAGIEIPVKKAGQLVIE